MKKYLIALLIIVFNSFNCYAMEINSKILEKNDIKFIVILNKKNYTIEEPINFKIKIYNTSDKIFFYEVGSYPKLFDINVTNKKDVYKFKDYEARSIRPKPIYPGEYYEYEIKNLNKYIKGLKKKGDYRIDISIKYWQEYRLNFFTAKKIIADINNIHFKIKYEDDIIEKQGFISDLNKKNKSEKGSSVKAVIKYLMKTKKMIKVLPHELKDKIIIKSQAKDKLFSLKKKEKNELFEILGTPYIVDKAHNYRIGWLFDDGSLLCSDTPMKIFDDNIEIEYEFYWNSIEIPKNIKKVYINKPKEPAK